jgi:hypothetical protein
VPEVYSGAKVTSQSSSSVWQGLNRVEEILLLVKNIRIADENCLAYSDVLCRSRRVLKSVDY